MIPGKIYSVLGEVILLPEVYFPNDRFSDHDPSYEDIISITRDSRPNFFLFTNHVYDNNKTLYAKVMYKSKFYVIQNEYHIGNFLQLLS